jgi:hypothetical protein
LLLLLPSAVHAQDPTPLELATATCIAPGFSSNAELFDLIASLPERNCIRACKAVAKGCKDVVKTVDQCGVKFLQAAIKVGVEVCLGLGNSPLQCAGVTTLIKPDIDWWKAQGKLEKAACDADSQTLCLSRCDAEASASLIPLPPT